MYQAVSILSLIKGFPFNYVGIMIAALRASLGRSHPFKLRFVEIGNEARLFSVGSGLESAY